MTAAVAPRHCVVVGLGLCLGLAAGCVDNRAAISGTQSIGVELVDPASPGDIQHRLPDGLRTITVNLAAYDADFEVDTSFDREVQVHVQYLGTLTPALGHDPLAKPRLTAGKAMNQTIALPPVFGPSTLWIEDGGAPSPSYATGTSPTLWFRDPYIVDVQKPASEMPTNPLNPFEPLDTAPLADKQVSVTTSRYGALGKLVVTSVFSQGYTVSDARCSDASGAPPCVAAAYDHIEVFSFSAPRDQRGRLLRQGQVIDGFSGGVSDFNGLTEVGFPVTFATSDEVVPGREPAPVKLDKNTWFRSLSDPQGIINFERNEAAPIEIDNSVVCALDNNFATFKQWKLDPAGVGGDCSRNSNVINVITAGVIADLDPATLVGKMVPRVVGIVRPVEIMGFNVWIIYPRSAADLTLP
jgi:hypothetical protein